MIQARSPSEDLVERSRRIRQSYDIAGKRIFPNVYLAPMSGVTDICFRRLISRLAGGRTGMLVSEFISVEGLSRLTPLSCRQMRFAEEERPFAVQIFGGEPEKMGWAARRVEEAGADIVEINCGCPVPRVVNRGGGSSLLRDLPKLASNIRAVKSAVNIPVTVKVRLGWSDDSINVLETRRIAEQEGAAAFIIHGRTRQQGYRGLADWDTIHKAATRADIPVIGNGDVLTVEDVVQRLETYAVHGIAVGRGAMHNPWLFGQVADLYEGRMPTLPDREQQKDVFTQYHDLLMEDVGAPLIALGKLKQMAARLMKCLPGGAESRRGMLRSQTIGEFFDQLDVYYEHLPGNIVPNFASVRELNGKDESEPIEGNAYRG